MVQIVTNNEDLREYAAEIMFQALEPKIVHETTVKVTILDPFFNIFTYILLDWGLHSWRIWIFNCAKT